MEEEEDEEDEEEDKDEEVDDEEKEEAEEEEEEEELPRWKLNGYWLLQPLAEDATHLRSYSTFND